jgi:hypothetical protein
VRAFPKEEGTILYFILKFRIVGDIDTLIDDDLVLLAAFAARSQCFVND